jgi:hypothetical protein
MKTLPGANADARRIIQRLIDERLGAGLRTAEDWEAFRVLHSASYYLFWGELEARARRDAKNTSSSFLH